MKRKINIILYFVLLVFVLITLCYLDIMLGVTIRYDVTDLFEVIGQDNASVFYRFWTFRIALTIVIASLMIIQAVNYKPNHTIPLLISLLSSVFLIMYIVNHTEISHIITSNNILTFRRAFNQLKNYIDSNVISYFLCVFVFLLGRFILLKKDRE